MFKYRIYYQCLEGSSDDERSVVVDVDDFDQAIRVSVAICDAMNAKFKRIELVL